MAKLVAKEKGYIYVDTR
ncbi:MAG: hypothetical protein ACLTZ8_03185 [Mediterraneibacter faecis]